jgi:ectoine hydroxylase-related dioxygenase (phytanoyl-CoA dioxygenase family)
MTLSSVQAEKYERDGFLLVRELFDEDWRTGVLEWLTDLAQRREQLPKEQFVLEPAFTSKAVQSEAPCSIEGIRKFEGLVKHSEALRYFGADTPGARLTEQLIGRDDLRIMYLSAFAKPAGHGSETPWHQDQALWPNWMPTATSCWVALDPCTHENGCLQFLRGSHREGLAEHVMPIDGPHQHIPADRADPQRVVSLLMDPGDAVFFPGRVWHFSEANCSSHRRLGIVAVYASDAELRDAADNAAFVAQKQRLSRPIGSDRSWYESRPWASKSGRSVVPFIKPI